MTDDAFRYVLFDEPMQKAEYLRADILSFLTIALAFVFGLIAVKVFMLWRDGKLK